MAEHDLVDALVLSAFTTTAVLARVAGDNNLSLTQFRVLGILRDRRVRMGDLATYLGIERSSLSGLIERAEARGLVGREVNAADGRAVDVFLTAEGKRFARRAFAEVQEALAPSTDSLTATERDRLQRLLEKLLSPTQVG